MQNRFNHQLLYQLHASYQDCTFVALPSLLSSNMQQALSSLQASQSVSPAFRMSFLVSLVHLYKFLTRSLSFNVL